MGLSNAYLQPEMTDVLGSASRTALSTYADACKLQTISEHWLKAATGLQGVHLHVPRFLFAQSLDFD